MKLRNILLASLLFPVMLYAQEKKSVDALRITEPLTLDGILDEEIYNLAQPASDFVQLVPNNGKASPQASTAWFFYDDNAVYVGAMLYDTAPDSIYNYVSERDNIGVSDYFGVYFDPYNQGQLAYGFFITPGGTQTDIKAIKKEYDDEDDSWNAVWYSKTKISDEGWSVEMRIPYSELRLPDTEIQTWGLNMFRRIRRYYCNTSWNLIDRKINGFIHQQGELTGIENIDPPIRLSLTPYLAGYYESGSARVNSEFLYKGGLDLKFGMGESYTVDMMLIPDFGQVQSDDQELNLSPYELHYDEKRQFFNEGTELFQRADVFYSRRIGASPLYADNAEDQLKENEEIRFSPSETRLVNATKLSGRSSKGLGVGVLNAMSMASHAQLRDTLTGETREVMVQPFTNYNVLVFDQSLKNSSYFSLINTNMKVINSDFMANVTGTEFEIRDKSKTFKVSGKAGLSVRGEENKDEGWYGELGLEKNIGNAEFGINQEVYSDTYDPNDMGYQRRNNFLATEAFASYQIIEPFSIFNEVRGSIWTDYDRIYEPSVFANSAAGVELFSQFKNNYYFFINTGFSSKEYDYYEPRISGRYFIEPSQFFFFVYMQTDYNKRLGGNFDYELNRYSEGGWRNHEAELEINLRLGRRFELEYGIEGGKRINDKGYVDNNDNEDSIFFANRLVHTLSNKLEASYIINKDMGIHFRTRHYWSSADNKNYYLLNTAGALEDAAEYNSDHNQNYNAFTLDMDFRWVFAPGSEMILAWKKSIFTDEEFVIPNYWDNINTTRRGDHLNSISLKLLYYLDYNSLSFSRKI